MKPHLFGSMAAVAAVTLILGCAGDPTEALRGDVARVTQSYSYIELDVGETLSVFAQALDEQGNALSTLPEVTSANAAIAAVSLQQATSRGAAPRRDFTVTAAGYGSTQVLASVGNITDTLEVVTFPASLGITGAGDTLASGSTMQLAVECFDTQGNLVTPLEGAEPVSWSSYDARIAVVDDAGLVFAKSLGQVSIVITVRNGTSDNITFDVVPGSFQGNASATSGPSGTVVTYTVGAAQPKWDSDTEVFIGGQQAFIMSDSDDTNLITAILFGLEAGPTQVLLTRIGPDQLALVTTFDIDALATGDDLEPNNRFDGTPPTPVTLPFEDVLSVDLVDQDDFFAFTLTQDTTISLFLNWDDALNADLDLRVTDAAFTAYQCEFVTSGVAHPERGTCALAAGDYLLSIDNFDASATGNPKLTNYHIFVEVQ